MRTTKRKIFSSDVSLGVVVVASSRQQVSIEGSGLARESCMIINSTMTTLDWSTRTTTSTRLPY